VTGGAEAIVAGLDAALWFTEPTADGIGRLTTAGAFSAHPVTPGSHPLGIAAGSDGALWFTEEQGGRIGRITTTGAVAEYPLALGADPAGIALGSDGALWFTEPVADRIGRIATDGTIAEYPVPTLGAQPTAIAAGPDGALWFTEIAAGRIGRIDPATHAVTELPTGEPGSGPQGIAAGPDGALWFTEQAANKVARMTTAGALTEFDAAPGPFGITLGRDGALWFTQAGMGLPGAPSAPGLIGRLTAGGVLDLFPLHPQTGASPNDIAVGPDGAIWITDGAAIARVGGDVSGTVPKISRLSLTPRSFRVPGGPRRTLARLRFGLSTAATLSLEISRRSPGRLLNGSCRAARPRLAALPSCVALRIVDIRTPPPAPAGRQSISLDGRDGNGRRLAPGSYEAGIIAYGTRVGRPAARSIRFTILR
jgi:virginiamycin B lyase